MKVLARRYALLCALRWLPVGLILPVEVLLLRARGLSLAAIGGLFAVYTAVVGLLELPTGGVADRWGRRPVLILSSSLTLAGLMVMGLAAAVPALVGSILLLAVGRALASGPLEAWFVDAAHAIDEQADVTPGLAGGSFAESAALALGAIGGGILPTLASGLPDAGDDPLLSFSVTYVLAAMVVIVEILALLMIVGDVPSRRHMGEPSTSVVATIRAGIRLGTRDAVVRRVLLRYFAAGLGFVGFELLVPVRLGDLLGDPTETSALYAVFLTVGFAGSAVGAGLAVRLRRRAGSAARGALLASVAGGLLGIVAGVPLWPVLAFGYIGLYIATGPARPLLGEVLHARVGAAQRATLLSVQSLAAMSGAVLGSLALPALADASSTGLALALGGGIISFGALPLAGLFAPLPVPAHATFPEGASLESHRAS
jgi:MFS family permease